MTRKIRTPEQQEYRDNLAHNLKELRKSGDVGRSLAETLLESEKSTAEYVASSVEKFDNNLAEDLIKKGDYEFLVENLDKFNGLTKEVAKALIDECYSDEVLENLDKFEGLDEDIAYCFEDDIQDDARKFKTFLNNLDKFRGLSMSFADTLVISISNFGHGGDGEYDGMKKLLNNLNSFELCDCEEHLAERFGTLMYDGGGTALCNGLEKFKGLDYNKLAKKMSYIDDGWPLIAYIETFIEHNVEGIDYKKEANDVMNGVDVWAVAEHMDLPVLQGIDYDKLAKSLMEQREYEYIVWHLDKFKGINYNELAHKMIKDNEVGLLRQYLHEFEGLDKKVAKSVIDDNYGDGGEYVLENIELFDGLDKEMLEHAMRNAGRIYDFIDCLKGTIDNIGKVKGLDQQGVVELWIEAGRGHNIAIFLSELQGCGYKLDYQKLAEKVIEARDCISLINNLGKIQGLDKQKIAYLLVEYGNEELFIKNINKFENFNFQELAEDLILYANRRKFVVDNLDKFKGIDYKKICEKLIKAGHGEYVAKNLEKFGFKKEE